MRSESKHAERQAEIVTSQYEARYAIELHGVSALIMNKPNLLGGKEDKGRDPAQYEREHFMDKCYRDGLGQLVIPARAIKKAHMEACKFIPEKPRGVAFKSFMPFMQAATIIPDDAVLDVTDAQVLPLELVVSLDPSKGNKSPRGPRTRPMIATPWQARTTIIVFDPILTPAILTRIGDTAGKLVGFLDGRAIDFGRALVTVHPIS